MRSSYIQNNFGEKFEMIVRACRPLLTVELGVLDGYSLLAMGKGAAFNLEHFNMTCCIDAYDLFDDYQFKHGNQEEVQKLINEKGYQKFITLTKANAYEVHTKYPDRSIYLLHVDISNTGETVRKIMENWNQKMVHNGIILFEGGSVERDNIEWMLKYNMPSIRKEINTNSIIDKFYVVGCYEKFPSLTFLYKKYDEEHMP